MIHRNVLALVVHNNFDLRSAESQLDLTMGFIIKFLLGNYLHVYSTYY